MKSYLIKILAGLNSFALTITSIFLSFIAPIQGLVFLSIILCLFDFLTKIYLVYRQKGFKAIESKKMGDTGFKILFYCSLLIVLQLIHNIFFVEFGHSILSTIFDPENVETMMKLNITSVGAFLIIVREIKSIDENWESFSGWSFIETVASKFSWFFKLKNGTTTSKKTTEG